MPINPAADMNPETLDLDAWIDGVVRPETTVLLYANDAHYQAEVARIEALIPVAEKTKPEDRGLDDPSVESLAAQLADLRAERDATALRVRIRQVTRAERAAISAAQDAASDDILAGAKILAEAILEPKFTAEQLTRLYRRDQTGESMVEQLSAAVLALGNGLPVPS